MPSGGGESAVCRPKTGLEPGIFCAIHTYGRRLNWHPHVHVSVTCGGLNKHGQWKKLSFLKDAMRSRWMWNMRQLLLKAWSEGWQKGVVVNHDGITVEKPSVLKSGGKYWHCTCRRRQPEGGIRHAIAGSLSEEATNSGFPTGSLQRRASLSFRYGPQNGRNGDGNADTA
ncbi:transposase [Escherichia coli]|uniref:transposase n=1 Tax=Escherichia coli TaxID=562 RepID=UPI003DA74460